MAHWDVSSELRGEHGKWSKSGIIHKLAEEAKSEGAKKEAGKIEAGHRVSYKNSSSVGTVHHIDEKGVPHVVWDRGRGKPVRTPAHHLSHVGEQKSAPTGHMPERGAHETPSQERHLDETLRKLSGRQPAAEKKTIPYGATPPQKGKSPEEAMSRADLEWRANRGDQAAQTELIKRLTAEQKAKTEAENKRRFPQGSVTEYKDISTRRESPEYLAKLRGGGTSSEFDAVHSEYLHNRNLVLTSNRVGGNPGARKRMDEAEKKLRAMGARPKFGSTKGEYEMPPKPGSPEHAKEKLRDELMSINEQLHDQHVEAGAPRMTDVELISTRFPDVNRQLKAGEKTIVVKVPSGSEIQMSRETAQHLVNEAIKKGTSSSGAPRTTAERRAGQQARLAEAAARSGIGNRGRTGQSSLRREPAIKQGTATATQIATVQGQIRRIEELLKDPQMAQKYGHEERDRQVKRLAQKRALLVKYLGKG